MKESNRTFNSTKNALFAIICQSLTILLSFVTRSVLIHTLSQTYIGLNGIFANIIDFLNLAELGIGNILLFNLYKPLANNDEKRVVQILNLFKKIYTVIALVILGLGILIIPILPYILNGVSFTLEVLIIYLLFLINTVCSYIYNYKMFLLTADQKNHIVSIVTIFVILIKEIFQITVLLLFKNFYLYLIVLIITTILKNIILSIITDKKYDLKIKVEELAKSEKKAIYSDFKDIFFYKVASVIIYGTDNLLMSILIKGGTIIVGIYSNYLLITNSLKNVITAFFQGMIGSVGNLNVKSDNDKKYLVYRTLNFMAYFIYGVCCICLFMLVNPFIKIFAGENYLFSFNIVIVIIIYFYIDGTFTPTWIFRETAGIFKKSKNMALLLAILNIILSIILGLKFGVIGILGATIISRLLTTYFYEPYLIVKKYLNKSFGEFILNNFKNLIKNLFTGLIIYLIFKNIVIKNYLDFIIYGLLIFTLSSLILLILHLKEEELNFIIDRIKLLFRKYFKKNKRKEN